MGAFVLMARGARVDGDGAARARVLPVKTPSRTSLSLLPQPPSSASTEAPQPMCVCATWMLFWQARRSAGFRCAAAVN